MSKKWTIRILLGAVILLVAIQFIPTARNIELENEAGNFNALARPPAEISDLLNMACMDCHSQKTTYPWYASVAPISWLINNHVEEGREHLNFSTWGTYNFKQQAEKAAEAAEEVGERHMPLAAYTWMHGDAQLSDAQRNQLVVYFQQLEAEINAVPPIVLPNFPGLQ